MTGTEADRILVVDDDAGNRYVKVRTLQREGFLVSEAGTGMEGLALTAATRPHLIVMDVKLPDINGYEVCRRIKSDPELASIAVLQTSASFVRGSDQVRGLEGGADSYLTQPFEPIVLVATVKALLRIRRAEQRQAELFEQEREARRKTAATENLFNLLVDNVRDYAILILDPMGRVLVWNNGAQRILGYSADEAIGRTLEIIAIPEDDASALQREMEVARKTGRSEDDRWHRRKDGTRFWATGVMHSLLAENGELQGYVKILRDMTSAKRLEEERAEALRTEQAARKHAESINRMKDDFLATLSHELRTPLTSLVGWTKLLKSGTLDKAQVQHGINVIERNVNAQAQLINDLLDVSRIIAGKMPLNMQPVQLEAIAEAAIESIRPAADAKGIRITRQLDTALFVGDPDRIHQILLNLLSNAVKFTPKSGSIEVNLVRGPETIRISVRDTGRGINPEFLPHVFERFRQADSSSTRASGGLGLGLAIVSHLVHMHGGKIHGESEGEGYGATFIVSFPVVQTAPAKPAEVESGRRAPSGRLPSLAGKRILVVEDEPDCRELVTMLLRSCGAEVEEAASVRRALEILDTFTPDTIVSDIGMPGQDGISMIQTVRARFPDQPLVAIALTAYAHEGARERIIAAGFQVHLTKPVEPLKLIETIHQLSK